MCSEVRERELVRSKQLPVTTTLREETTGGGGKVEEEMVR